MYAVSNSPIYATNAHESRSKRYSFISTSNIIQTFNEQGFEVTSIQYPKVRKHTKEGYSGHMVRMRQSNLPSYTDEVPEVIIVNSHDGTKSLRLGLGFIRFVCMNGLITGDMLADTGKVYHKGNAADNVLEYINNYSKNVSEKILRITDMKNTVLSLSELEEFQYRASEIVNPSIYEPNQLGFIHRNEDREATVWNTFNVIQENAMKGSYQINGSTKVRKARPVRDITRNLHINTKLWDLAESFVV